MKCGRLAYLIIPTYSATRSVIPVDFDRLLYFSACGSSSEEGVQRIKSFGQGSLDMIDGGESTPA